MFNAIISGLLTSIISPIILILMSDKFNKFLYKNRIIEKISDEAPEIILMNINSCDIEQSDNTYFLQLKTSNDNTRIDLDIKKISDIITCLKDNKYFMIKISNFDKSNSTVIQHIDWVISDDKSKLFKINQKHKIILPISSIVFYLSKEATINEINLQYKSYELNYKIDCEFSTIVKPHKINKIKTKKIKKIK